MIARVIPAVRLPAKAAETYEYRIPETLAPSIRRGAVVLIPFRNREATGLVIEVTEKPETDKTLKEISGLAQGLRVPEAVVSLWIDMARGLITTLPRFLWLALPPIPKRPINEAAAPAARSAAAAGVPPCFHYVNRHADALRELAELVRAGAGRQALALFPTKGEAVSAASRITGARVLHADMSAGAKFELAMKAATGAPLAVFGTKSAVFLPFSNLACVAVMSAGSALHVNEDQDPRYDARTVAERLSAVSGAEFRAFDPLPPLGYTRTGSEGRWRSANNPAIFRAVVHDLSEEAKRERARVMLARGFLESLREAVAEGGNALVFMNRRGLFGSASCRDCGWEASCGDCGQPLMIDEGRSACPACARPSVLPSSCGKCGGTGLKMRRWGSKTLSDCLKKEFPGVKVAHMDKDGGEVYGAQILVGTSAIFRALPPQAHPFAWVGDALLGAGAGAEGARSVEEAARNLRTLGSLSADGTVHVQSFDAEAPAIKALGHCRDFLGSELEERKALGYPPAGKVAVFFGSGPRENEIMSSARELMGKMRGLFPDAELFGPEWEEPKFFKKKFRLKMTLKLMTADDVSAVGRMLPEGFGAYVQLM